MYPNNLQKIHLIFNTLLTILRNTIHNMIHYKKHKAYRREVSTQLKLLNDN